MDDPAPPKPRIHILYGDDALGITEKVNGLRAEVVDSTNVAILEGGRSSLDEVYTAAYVLPFFAERRLVILKSPTDLAKTKAAQERLISLLEGLPETTTLALVIPDTYLTQGGSRGWAVMDDGKKGKFLLEWSKKKTGFVQVGVYRPPAAREMPEWIRRYTEKEGGKITPAAAAALAQSTGTDTGIARQEIIKLLAYVNYSRPVDVDDVQDAASSGGESNLFGMVDALANGDHALALRLLQRLLEEQDAYSLFGMIVRQYRLLLQAKEALNAGPQSESALAARLRILPFVAGKILAQTRRYSLTDLEAIYHRLAEIDMIMKTGRADPQIALQTFVAAPTKRTL